ncbi:DEAD/DEAH box helicase, partial [Paraglaciecola sp.]
QQLIKYTDDLRPIRALVLTPTRELAQQVYKNFVSYAENTHLNIAVAYGGVSINPQLSAMEKGVDILIATPGRLLDHIEKGSVDLSQLQTIVFDEADRMLDMGFKDEINRVLVRLPNKRQTLLFSATFDDAIFKLSKTLLNTPTLIEVSERNAAATQVDQLVYTVDSDRKRELTSYLIGSKNWHQVLIFTRTKQMADALAKEMCKDGISTQSIHGDKSQGARERVLAEFKQGKTRALVATDVAARGIDIIDLKYVINYELPYVAEDYIHRIGRTGRAGNTGLAISLMSPNEEWLLEAVEKVLDSVLLQQWLPGYEPDLTKQNQPAKRSNRGKQHARNKALGIKPKKKRR